MTPADKRAIIDKIFSMEIINKVYELVKKDRKELGNSINISNSQIFSYEQTIKTSQIELENLNNQTVEENPEDKLQVINQKLAKVADLYKQQSAIYAENYPHYTELENMERQLNMGINSENIEITHLKQKINLFNQDKCPTCGTPFNSGEFDEVKEKLNQDLIAREETLQKYNEGLVKLRDKKTNLSNMLTEVQSNMNKITAKQNELLAEYKAIENLSKQTTQTDAIQKIIDSTNESKAKLEKSIQEANAKMKLLDIMEELYSVDGIKQTLMSAYVPTLNQEIEKTLDFLGFPYTLTFDNNFDPHLEDLGKEIKPQSLSTGEHKKVDLTVLCSLLKMIKIKYPQINLVCLDETVSSLDYESSTEIIKYLKEISKDMDLNIFIVSHTQLEENLFDKHILAEKPAEYTVLSYI
jgi:DNA repair exonuclease SbcCD ATPase subunit